MKKRDPADKPEWDLFGVDMSCPECGKRFRPGVIECGLCGASLEPDPPQDLEVTGSDLASLLPDLESLFTFGELLSGPPKVADESMARLALREYRERVAAISPPDPSQMEAFADYVSRAHSWYKHLPYLLPGARCIFVIDPCVMMEDMPPRFGDRRRFRPYVSGESLFHYSSMPTAEYRRRFGCLAYGLGDEDRSISIPMNQSQGGVVEARLFAPPGEIGEHCATEITAVIHPYTATAAFWRRFLPEDADGSRWPIQSGGRERFDQIVAFCRDHDDREDTTESGLTELLRSERERQILGMIAAMKRLRILLWG